MQALTSEKTQQIADQIIEDMGITGLQYSKDPNLPDFNKNDYGIDNKIGEFKRENGNVASSRINRELLRKSGNGREYQ